MSETDHITKRGGGPSYVKVAESLGSAINVTAGFFRRVDGFGQLPSPLPDYFAKRLPKIHFQVEPRLVPRVPERDGVCGLGKLSNEIV